MEQTRRGLVQVYTGDGKGKTTASVGLAVRAVGSGMQVAFIQFVKGGVRSGELAMLEKLGIRVERPAERSTGLLGAGIHDDDHAAADAAWALAKDVLASGVYDLVIMDELNIAMRYELVSTDEVLSALDARPLATEVVITGRGAPEEIIERADLVTEMVLVKHPFDAGVSARKGIEY
ncbi:MAG: cob(I)yrinic acid a,c-diamide adenosyltransferase [Coriobacteriia bacterium]|nr:cob(I)yrinic acid a,c-diamide adenosyltransferase [Coriobacteriia bacterium]